MEFQFGRRRFRREIPQVVHVPGIEPAAAGGFLQNHRHLIAEFGHRSLGLPGKNGAGSAVARPVPPDFPRSRHGEGLSAGPVDEKRLFGSVGLRFPFVEAVDRDEAAADERGPEARIFVDRLGPGVDPPSRPGNVFGPAGNQAPAELARPSFARAGDDGQHLPGGRDVESGDDLADRPVDGELLRQGFQAGSLHEATVHSRVSISTKWRRISEKCKPR